MTGPPRHVAILAGGGDLPLQIAEGVTRGGARVHIVAIENEADARVAQYPHTWVNLGQASRMFAALRPPAGETGVMVIAGAVTRPDLLKLRPDFGLVRVLAQVLGLITAGGDDALLTRAIRIFEREGLTVVGVQDVAPEVMIGAGVLSAYSIDAQADADIARGHAVLAALGDLDVGQAIVIEGGRVLAIEGVEGTDRMLGRLAETHASGGRAILLKAPKPRQERRVDLPTIGLRTVERAHAAGIRGIAVVAGAAIGLQRLAMLAEADRLGLFVAGVDAPTHVDGKDFTTSMQGGDQRTGLDKIGLDKMGFDRDVETGVEAVARLAQFDTGAAATVVRGHVIGIAAVEGPAGLIARAARLSQWGLGRFGGKRGAIALRLGPAFGPKEVEALLPDIAKAGFASVGVVSTSEAEDVTSLRTAASRHRLKLFAQMKPPS